MTADLTVPLVPLILIGALVSCGVYLLLERNLTRMLLGLLLIGNGINLLILTVGGPSGNPPIRGRTGVVNTTIADPLAQAMILTAIVITMGVAAFVLALTYRSYRLNTDEEVDDDVEDARVAEEIPVEELDASGDTGTHPDTDEPDELDALPGREGSR
ncbi:MAG: Na(+)/H(+) antiporter subunit C [Mycobacterium sp.]